MGHFVGAGAGASALGAAFFAGGRAVRACANAAPPTQTSNDNVASNLITLMVDASASAWFTTIGLPRLDYRILRGYPGTGMKKMLLASLIAGCGFAQIKVHGHRGARALRPENTLPAFEYAIAQGVAAIELDMAVTRDNVIVVSHDPVLQAPVCSGPKPKAAIRELTLAQVRQWDCGAVRNPAYPRQQLAP